MSDWGGQSWRLPADADEYQERHSAAGSTPPAAGPYPADPYADGFVSGSFAVDGGYGAAESQQPYPHHAGRTDEYSAYGSVPPAREEASAQFDPLSSSGWQDPGYRVDGYDERGTAAAPYAGAPDTYPENEPYQQPRAADQYAPDQYSADPYRDESNRAAGGYADPANYAEPAGYNGLSGDAGSGYAGSDYPAPDYPGSGYAGSDYPGSGYAGPESAVQGYADQGYAGPESYPSATPYAYQEPYPASDGYGDLAGLDQPGSGAYSSYDLGAPLAEPGHADPAGSGAHQLAPDEYPTGTLPRLDGPPPFDYQEPPHRTPAHGGGSGAYQRLDYQSEYQRQDDYQRPTGADDTWAREDVATTLSGADMAAPATSSFPAGDLGLPDAGATQVGMSTGITATEIPGAGASTGQRNAMSTAVPGAAATSGPAAVAGSAGTGPSLLAAAAGLVLAAGSLAGAVPLAVALVLVQGAIAVGWFRLHGMWPARRGAAVVWASGIAADVAMVALHPGDALMPLIAVIGVGFVVAGFDRLAGGAASEAGRAVRVEALGAEITGVLFAVAPAALLAARHDEPGTAALAALAAAVAALLRAILAGSRSSTVPLLVAVIAATLCGAVGADATRLAIGVTGGLALGVTAGAVAAIGSRLADYDRPSRWVSYTAGVALPYCFVGVAAYLVANVMR